MRYKPYPKYKKSGVAWLGDVPEGWEISKLKYLSRITTGNKDTENKVDNGKYPFYVRSQTVEKINSYSFNGEAILTAGDGVGVGKVFHYTNGKFDFHQRVYLFYAFKKVDGKFLFEYIKNNFYKVALAGVAKSTVDSLRLPLIQNFMITVPPLKEQIQIANYLTQKTKKIDTLIKKQQILIELLKEKRQALISHAMTKGLEKRIKFNLILQNKKVIITNQEVISLENIESKSGKYIKTDSAYKGEDVAFKKGDVLFGKLRPYLAKVFECKNDGVAFGDLLVFRPNKNMDSTFVFYAMLSDRFISIVDSSTYGTKMPRASVEFINEMLMPTPPLKEQIQIANHLNQKTKTIDTLIEKSTKAIELLKERRVALVSAVVTGKVDVRGDN